MSLQLRTASPFSLRRALSCSALCFLCIASAFGQLSQDAIKKQELRAWRSFFELSNFPVLLDVNGLAVPQLLDGTTVDGEVQFTAVRPIAPDYLNLWAKASSRRIVPIPGGYVFRRTRVNPEFGPAGKSYWLLGWMSDLSEEQLQGLARGSALGGIDPKGQLLLASLADNLSGGFPALVDPSNNMKAQTTASIELSTVAADGTQTYSVLGSHPRVRDFGRGSVFPPDPLPPLEPAAKHPKSTYLDFKDGELVTLEQLLIRLFREANVWIVADRRHLPEPIFVKGTWDSYALAEALKKYHETEPLFVGDYNDEVARLADSFEESFSSLSSEADSEFKRLAELEEKGQTITWAQLEADFPETFKGWTFSSDSKPGPNATVRLKRYVSVRVSGVDASGQILPSGLTFSNPKPTLSP
jgi:hypothetical protein